MVVQTVGGCERTEAALPRVLLLLVLRLHLLRLTVVLLHELSALLFVHLTCCPLSRVVVCSGNVTIETSFFDDTLLVAKAVMRLYYD